MAWITGAEILVQSGAIAPGSDPASASAADIEWSELVAAGIDAGINRRLEGGIAAQDTEPEIRSAARTAGVDAYKRREAVFGVTGYVDLQGAAIRVSRDALEGIGPVLARYATFGIA